ncbi:DNA starvation/stationary phase protection protein Dps [Falsiroseomonas oryziterrae]|uniref:DNA starvation/stationary phase protection protein Dps n=1 Tax=Falsiroseomonas oryziterrae TaxID=2911368 RepID=UPI001F00DBBA|nr:DNA starvation/stationary phase protection protein Dps [Roseomonas sp. NPKOSM-4]
MPSRNDLHDNAKRTSIEVLDGVLADSIDLYNMTRHAHWNVKGPHFASLHQLFETFYAQLATDIDELAERLVTLGGTAMGVSQSIPGRTRLPPYPAGIRQGQAHLENLLQRYALVAGNLRAGVEATDEAGDADTADLLTGLSRNIDKAVWMMEATAETA